MSYVQLFPTHMLSLESVLGFCHGIAKGFCHEGLGGSGDDSVETVRLGDGLEKREILKFFDKMGLLGKLYG